LSVGLDKNMIDLTNLIECRIRQEYDRSNKFD